MRFKKFFKDLVDDNVNEYTFVINDSSEQSDLVQTNELIEHKAVYPTLAVNLEYLTARFNTLINSDIKIREFLINAKGKQYKSFIIYIDGLVNDSSINDFILKPLMLKNASNQFNQTQIISEAVTSNISVRKIKRFSIKDYIYECLLPQNDVEKLDDFDKITDEISSGNCLLFIDTIDFAFDISVKKFEQRSIAEPKNESVVMGSQEAFVEALRTNTSMIRRNLPNENLVIESLTIGKTGKNKTSVCYLKNIANSDLVAEVKYRLNNLEIDYLVSIGELEQVIKDDIHTSVPEMITTERVDKAVSYLLQGRVVVVYNGSPYVLIMPATLFDFLTVQEDSNINYIFANMLRIIRILCLIITLLLPGLYIAITTFHDELIPTELLFSIVESRIKVPFLVIVEIALMELSFEIIREAGLRVPSPLGNTVGIVGALVLGQAAVQANIVSPILIIIIAITGITSFAIPDYNLSFHFRITRFAYTLFGALSGFFGLGIGIFMHLILFCSLHSFGVSYLAPYAPLKPAKESGFLAKPIWKKENRSSFLNSKKKQIQSKYSLKWKKG